MSQEYTMFRLSTIPNKYNEILIPPYPFLATYQKDTRYIEAECPKTSKWYLCEIGKNLKVLTSNDCIQQLVTTQQRLTTCQSTSVSLEKAALEQLDDRHYTYISLILQKSIFHADKIYTRFCRAVILLPYHITVT